MIVVAIIGILAAVAVPAYRDYAIRAKVSEVLLEVGKVKTDLSLFYARPVQWGPSGLGLDSPRLRARISDSIDILYPKSRRDAARETGLPLSAFPETCPYHIDEILNPDFIPEGAGAE